MFSDLDSLNISCALDDMSKRINAMINMLDKGPETKRVTLPKRKRIEAQLSAIQAALIELKLSSSHKYKFIVKKNQLNSSITTTEEYNIRLADMAALKGLLERLYINYTEDDVCIRFEMKLPDTLIPGSSIWIDEANFKLNVISIQYSLFEHQYIVELR